MDESKGSKFLIELSKIDKFNDYYIYGGTKKIINDMKKKNKNKNLHLNEYVSYKNLKYCINKIDILVMPSNKKNFEIIRWCRKYCKIHLSIKII